MIQLYYNQRGVFFAYFFVNNTECRSEQNYTLNELQNLDYRDVVFEDEFILNYDKYKLIHEFNSISEIDNIVEILPELFI